MSSSRPSGKFWAGRAEDAVFAMAWQAIAWFFLQAACLASVSCTLAVPQRTVVQTERLRSVAEISTPERIVRRHWGLGRE